MIDAWAEQKIIREIMVFLQSHGPRAVRIFKTLRMAAVGVELEETVGGMDRHRRRHLDLLAASLALDLQAEGAFVGKDHTAFQNPDFHGVIKNGKRPSRCQYPFERVWRLMRTRLRISTRR